MDAHPIDAMLRAGLRATINSDDPAYFGGYVNDNYRAAAKGRGLDRDDLATLARNSFLGSFLGEAEKAAPPRPPRRLRRRYLEARLGGRVRAMLRR